MSLLEETKRLLRSNRIVPNKLLGQNFMTDLSIFELLVAYASVNHKDVVLDIGAGFGFLSNLLSDKCKTVVAVERDPNIVGVLCNQLMGSVNVKIVQGDILQAELPVFNKVVSIPPYQISSRLLVWLLGREFETAVLVLQKEFAKRLVASIGSDDYGWLSVLAYYRVETELLDTVPKTVFYPQPQVDSVVVRVRPKSPPPFVVKNQQLLVKIARSLFTQRNRKVRNAIVPFLKGECQIEPAAMNELAKAIPVYDKRVRELAPDEFGALANAFAK